MSMKGKIFKTNLGVWMVYYEEVKRTINPENAEIDDIEYINREVLLHPKNIDEAVIDKEIEFEIIKVNDHYYHSSPQYTDYAVILVSKEDKEKEMYMKLENLIIDWSNDGTKTAGFLTRQILDLVND